jgi:hypothetical protein
MEGRLEGRPGISVAKRLQLLRKNINEVELEDLYYTRIKFEWAGGEKEMTFTEFLKASECEAMFQSFNCEYVLNTHLLK